MAKVVLARPTDADEVVVSGVPISQGGHSP
jgi:hypothetical protein